MIKKIWFSLLFLFGILFVWVSFANPIAPKTHYVCSMFENVEIDNYRVVVQKGSEFYEPMIKECSECEEDYRKSNSERVYGYRWWDSGPTQNVYLLDKSIDIKNITVDNIESNAILIWSITSTFCDILYKDETKLYKVVKSIDGYSMLDRTNHYNVIQEMKNKLKQFPIFWFLAVVIETLILFFIAKIFRKEEWITNKRIFLFWIIPTTITLPLLRFLLPLVLWEWTRYTIIWEILVIIIESIIIKYWLNISRKRGVIASFLCNLSSFITLSIQAWDLNISIIWLLLHIITTPIVLLVIWKWLVKIYEISNRKFILIWLISPIVSTIWTVIILYTFENLQYFSEWLSNIIIVLIKISIDVLILKYWLRIPRKKWMIMGIICNLVLFILIFIVKSLSYFIRYKL